MSTASFENPSLDLSVSTYFQQVLGVHSVLLKSEKRTEKKSVLFLLPQALSVAAQDLLEKMIGAMKLRPEDYEVALKDLSPGFENFSQVIEFVDTFESVLSDPSHLRTWSPEALLQKPELKKAVWADLQRVMKKLS